MEKSFIKKFVVLVISLLSISFFYGEVHSEEGDITGAPEQAAGHEDVDFHLASIDIEIVCLKKVVNIQNIDVSADEEIERVEYSLDGGISWTEVDSVPFDLNNVPFGDGLLVLKLRVLVEGETFTSVDKYVPTSCGQDLIFGYYFENNSEPAIITRSGDILFNPNHEMEIFVEASYGISEVKVYSGEESFSLDYDYSNRLWSGKIPQEFLSEKQNTLEVVGRSGADFIKKFLPMIFNSKFYVPELEDVYGKHEIYYFNGYEWEKISYECDELNYPIFTLLPGKYYIKLERENGWFYSSIFEIDEKSIVSLNALETSYPAFFQWLERYFTSMDVVVFDSAFYVEHLEVQDVSGLGDFVEKNGKDSIVMYVNRWNPWYKSSLRLLENLVDEHNIVLITDENNYGNLSSALKNYGDSIDLYNVADSAVLRELLMYQPQIVYYSYEDEEFHITYSLQSFVRLNNFLNN